MRSIRNGRNFLCSLGLSVAGIAFTGCGSNPTPTASTAQPTRTASHIDDQPIKASIATLVVHGMGCPQCSTNVDKQLLAVPGVQKVQINLGTGEVDVRLSPQQPPTGNELAAAIKKSGYTLVRIETGMEPVPHGNGKTATVEK